MLHIAFKSTENMQKIANMIGPKVRDCPNTQKILLRDFAELVSDFADRRFKGRCYIRNNQQALNAMNDDFTNFILAMSQSDWDIPTIKSTGLKSSNRSWTPLFENPSDRDSKQYYKSSIKLLSNDGRRITHSDADIEDPEDFIPNYTEIETERYDHTARVFDRELLSSSNSVGSENGSTTRGSNYKSLTKGRGLVDEVNVTGLGSRAMEHHRSNIKYRNISIQHRHYEPNLGSTPGLELETMRLRGPGF